MTYDCKNICVLSAIYTIGFSEIKKGIAFQRYTPINSLNDRLLRHSCRHFARKCRAFLIYLMAPRESKQVNTLKGNVFSS